MGWTKVELNQLGYEVVAAAIEVHKLLGPGLLESVYEECLVEEMRQRGIATTRQVAVPIIYKGMQVKAPLRLDILVEDILIVEVKAVETVLPVHEAQLLSYLKMTQKPKGILFNFNTTNITKSAVHRVTKEFGLLP